MHFQELTLRYSRKMYSIANDGTKFYFKTNKDAPQYKLVSIDIASEKREFKEVIPEDKDAHLEDVLAISDDKLIVVYKRNVSPPPPLPAVAMSSHHSTIGQGRNLCLLDIRRTPYTRGARLCGRSASWRSSETTMVLCYPHRFHQPRYCCQV